MNTDASDPDALAGARGEPSLERQLRQVLAELEMVSHVPARDYARSQLSQTPDEPNPGGKRPSGGADDLARDADAAERGDFRENFRHKSAEHFKRRIRAARTEHALREILTDAQRCLAAWKVQQMPDGRDPEPTSPRWKAWVAAQPQSDEEIARKFNVSRQYVNRIRKLYRDDAA